MKLNIKIIITLVLISSLILEMYFLYNNLVKTSFIFIPIPPISIFIYNSFILKNKSILLFTFILFNALAYSSFFIDTHDYYTYYVITYLRIIAHFFLLIYIFKKINFKILIKKYIFLVLILNILAIYIINSLYHFIVDNASQWQLSNMTLEMSFFIIITLILVLSFANYAHQDSKKEFLLFIFCTGLAFSEIITAMVYFPHSLMLSTIFKYLEPIIFHLHYIAIIYYCYLVSQRENEGYLNLS